MEQFLFRNDSRENDSSDNAEEHDSGPDPVLYCTILAVIAAIGVTGNCLILVLFSTKRYNRTSYSVYVRTLAVSDCLVLITTLIDDVLTRLADPVILHGTRNICFVWLFVIFFTLILSSALILAIAVDRYIAVCKPNRRDSICTFKRAIWVTSFIVFACFVLSLPGPIWNELETTNLLDSEGVSQDDYRCPMSEELDFRLYEAITGFLYILFAPFCIVMVLNLLSAAAIRSSLKRQTTLKGERIGTAVHIKVTLSIIAVTISSVTLLLPLIVVEVVEMVIELKGTDDPGVRATIETAWDTCNVIRLINYAQNFYIFLIFGKEYRSVLRTLFGLDRKDKIHGNKSESGMDSYGQTEVSRI